MARKPARHRNRYCVTHRPIAVVVRAWQLISVRCSHEPGTFSHSHEARPYLPSIDEDNRLSAAAAIRCPQASCDAVKADFKTLDLVTLLIGPRAFVRRTRKEASNLDCRLQPSLVQRRKQGTDLAGR